MAKRLTNKGLQMVGARASGVAGAGAAMATMSIDDSTVAIAAGDDQLNDGGAVANEADVAIAAPTQVGQTVSHVGVFAAGVGTMTIKRICLHNDTAANVTTSSTTLCAGVDDQTFVKPADLSLTLTLKILYTSA